MNWIAARPCNGCGLLIGLCVCATVVGQVRVEGGTAQKLLAFQREVVAVEHEDEPQQRRGVVTLQPPIEQIQTTSSHNAGPEIGSLASIDLSRMFT